MRVILVEDDEVDVMYLERLFKKTDKYDASFFSNGREALTFLENSWDGVEELAVLSDINMPVMDGITLLQKIRENEKTSKLPVFVFTTSDDDVNIEKAFELDVSGYLLKPLTIAEFESSLEEMNNG